jgi:hypothetical protein
MTHPTTAGAQAVITDGRQHAIAWLEALGKKWLGDGLCQPMRASALLRALAASPAATQPEAEKVEAKRLDLLEQLYTDGARHPKAWREFMCRVAEVGFRAAIDAAIASQEKPHAE